MLLDGRDIPSMDESQLAQLTTAQGLPVKVMQNSHCQNPIHRGIRENGLVEPFFLGP